MESTQDDKPTSRQSVQHQKRPALIDTPFEDDDEDLQSSFLKDKMKKKEEPKAAQGVNPQDNVTSAFNRSTTEQFNGC